MAPRLAHREPQHTVPATERRRGSTEFPPDGRHWRPQRLHRDPPRTGDEAVHHPGEGDAVGPGEGCTDEQVPIRSRERETEARPWTAAKVDDALG